MRQALRYSTLLVAVTVIALWSSSREAATQSSTAAYGVTDLGTLGGADSFALGVSPDTAFPRIVGRAPTASGFDHAFVGNPFGIKDLGTLGGNLGGLRSEARATWRGSGGSSPKMSCRMSRMQTACSPAK